MAGKTGQEKGLEGELSLRFGLDVPQCLGIRTEPAAGRVPPEYLADGINVSLGGGNSVTERGGQEKITTTALGSAIDGMFDLGNDFSGAKLRQEPPTVAAPSPPVTPTPTPAATERLVPTADSTMECETPPGTADFIGVNAGVIITRPNVYATLDEYDADDDTSRCWGSSSTGWVRMRFTLSNPAYTLGTVAAVYLTYRVHASIMNSGHTKARAFLYVGGTRYYASAFYDSEPGTRTGFVTYRDTWALNPATGIAWTISDLNALEAGIEQESSAIDMATWTQLYVEVSYA